MPDRCVVFNCTSGYDQDRRYRKEHNLSQLSQFRPKVDQINEWEKRISRKDFKLKPTHTVCELHFEKKFIIETHELIISGQVLNEKRGKKCLTNDAVPTIFDGYPCYKRSLTATKRPQPSQRTPFVKTKKKKTETTQHTLETVVEDYENEEVHEVGVLDEDFLLLNEPKALIDSIVENPGLVSRCNANWHIHKGPNFVSFVHIHPTDVQIDRYVKITNDNPVPEGFLMQQRILDQVVVHTLEDLNAFIERVHKIQHCPGVENNTRSEKCLLIMEPSGKKGRVPVRCHKCAEKKRAMTKAQRKKLAMKYIEQRKNKAKNQRVVGLIKKLARRNTKILTLTQRLDINAKKLSEMDQQKVDDYIKDMPSRWQLGIRACISAARAKTTNGRRFNVEWVYECQLMRIKSLGLYKKMLRDNFLPLPSLRTLQRYMKRLRPSYGFQQNIFELLKEKAEHMTEADRHGALLIDEMKLSEALWFDKWGLQILGFVNLDQYTPEHQKDAPADHVLVMMFQGFKGQHFQTISAHLGKGAVKGPELSKLVLEAIRLLHGAGFFVDAVVSDAASWNRNMWSQFGIKKLNYEREASKKKYDVDDIDEEEVENEILEFAYATGRRQKPTAHKTKRVNKKQSSSPSGPDEGWMESSCVHPMDEKRRLWFVSDFPHLVKSIKQRVINAEELQTPHGKVKLNHWAIVMKEDEKRGIKVAPKLCNKHFQSESYAAMSVGLAFSFFSEEVATAMTHYKSIGVPGMEDCEPTVKFIREMNKLIDAANANTRKHSLKELDADLEVEIPVCPMCNKPHDENTPQRRKPSRQVIVDFLAFLQQWETMGVTRDKRLTASAAFGLRVTLSAAYELSSYLINDLKYEYFMTRRINQDALEHFFGEIRQGCGAHGHPDPAQFIQVYRLLMFKSLVKPPRGSNITGGQLLTSLLSMPDLVSAENKRQQIQLEKELDDALDTGEIVDCPFTDHNYYLNLTIDMGALRMFGGYVARRTRKISCAKSCEECSRALEAPSTQPLREDDDIIHGRTQGYLIIPSDGLMNILEKLEVSVLEVFQKTHLHSDLLFELTAQVKTKEFEEIGCQKHKRELTRAIMSLYTCTRLIFACEEYNKKFSENSKKKSKARQQQKIFRLTC